MAMSRLAGIAAKGVAGAVLVYTAANAEVPARVVEKLDKFKEDYGTFCTAPCRFVILFLQE